MAAEFSRRPKSPAVLAAVIQSTQGLPGAAVYPESSALALAASEPAGTVADATLATDSTREYQIGLVYDIPISLINSNPVGPRLVYTPGEVDDMAMKLRRDGQRQSATAYVDSAGKIILIDGETRLRASRQISATTLRVEIKAAPKDERALYQDARSANSDRREQSPLDDAIRWKDLLDRKIYESQVDIAKSLGYGEDTVSRTLSLSVLPMRVVHIISDYPDILTLRMLTALREYFAVKGEDETIELVYKVAKTGMGYREVSALRKTASQPPAKRPRSLKEPFTYQGTRGELRIFEENGRVELSITGLAGDALTGLHERLKAALMTPGSST